MIVHAFPVHFLQILLFMLIYSHCGIPIWDLFVYSLLSVCVCGIAETWIPYTDFDLLKSHLMIFVLESIIEMFLANLMTCCKIFVCLITDYDLKILYHPWLFDKSYIHHPFFC